MIAPSPTIAQARKLLTAEEAFKFLTLIVQRN